MFKKFYYTKIPQTNDWIFNIIDDDFEICYKIDKNILTNGKLIFEPHSIVSFIDCYSKIGNIDNTAHNIILFMIEVQKLHSKYYNNFSKQIERYNEYTEFQVYKEHIDKYLLLQ